ncbi:DUF6074 family protein [Mesorhizobium sp. IRAMC:0171]|uniref:DUF6074 family protein n=2 Tax=Mesorhizobium retamae TaxID=2912854 RepID=A0ABS9QM55_9HYPH|nr:DUF6074 family protein [Mesorhizobium sp. IRAMC:0171]MCG7508524.1 DUF6074 family protein [Mesorhizobium sp. IRAMC:0171]
MSGGRVAGALSLPLFTWQPPRKLILFPLTKRVGKIRHTAQKLLGKHGYDAELYWKQVVSSNRKHLERVGLSPDEVDSELRDFFDAVQCEMVRLTYRGRRPGGDVA